jgi:hypothetical protein
MEIVSIEIGRPEFLGNSGGHVSVLGSAHDHIHPFLIRTGWLTPARSIKTITRVGPDEKPLALPIRISSRDYILLPICLPASAVVEISNERHERFVSQLLKKGFEDIWREFDWIGITSHTSTVRGENKYAGHTQRAS